MARFFLFIAFIFSVSFSFGQEFSDSSGIVQLSGMVINQETFDPIPYANIAVLNTSRGTYTDENGFFSFVVRKEDRMKFSALGFKDKYIRLPDTLNINRFNLLIFAELDTINLAEAVVMPWPSREHFRIEFLELDVKEELQERALENLAMETLERLKYEVPTDANEHADFYLRQQAADFYYYGQAPPQRIFDPLAWAEFIKFLKKGKSNDR